MEEEIIEALESSVPVRGGKGGIGGRRTSTDGDIAVWRKSILRFINELDEDITVVEIRRVLEN